MKAREIQYLTCNDTASILHNMATKIQPKVRPNQTWRPNVEDEKLLAELKGRLGVSETDVIRLGLRKLAQAEGIRT